MFVCKHLGWKYFGTPRTGSRTVGVYLLNRHGAEQYGDLHSYDDGGDKDCHLFATVRHPYRRVLSKWADNTARKHRQAVTDDVNDFHEWVRRASLLPLSHATGHLPISQRQYLQRFDGRPLTLVATERLATSIATVLSVPVPKLPCRGRSQHGPPGHYFRHAPTLALLADRYAGDFQHYGYSPNDLCTLPTTTVPST